MTFIFVVKKLIVLLLLHRDTSSALSPAIPIKSKLQQTLLSSVKPNFTTSGFPLASSASAINTVLEWKELEFLFPSEAAKNKALADQTYIRGNSVPIDVGVHYGAKERRIFVTIPRFSIGRPMTLTTVVMDKSGPGGPLLRPYPDYTWQENPSKCEGMVSVFRIAMDPCNRMWVLDSGRIGSVQHCPPQLLLFDLKTDSLIHRHRFQTPTYRPISVFVTPVVDMRDKQCKNCFVYIADVGGYGLIVYDHARNLSWRVDNKLFSPTHLQERTESQAYTGKRLSQSAASAIDSSGIMYFGLGEEIALGCWNIDNPYGAPFTQIVVQDNTKLQFISGIKVVAHENSENLWMVTNRFQKFMSGTLNNSTVNFRILTGNVPELSKACRRRYNGGVNADRIFSTGKNNPDDINFMNNYYHGVPSGVNQNYFSVVKENRMHKEILQKIISDVKQQYENKVEYQRQSHSGSDESLENIC